MARQWFAEGAQTYEDGSEELFFEGRQLCEDQAAAAVTATGAVTAEVATLDGTGTLGVNATGAVTAEIATLDGTGVLTNSYTATGDLTAEVATLAGTGNYAELDTVSGTGAVTAEIATLDGTGTLGVNATGAVTAEVATLDGTGTHTAPTFTATAAVTAEVATLAGTGTAAGPGTVTGTGDLAAEAATLAGVGVLTNAYTATGAVTAEEATLAGVGVYTAVAPDFVEGLQPTWKARDPGVAWRLDDPGNTWRGRGETDVEYARLEKRDDWSRNYNFSFEEFAEVEASQTLSDPTVTFTPSGLTVGTPAVSGGVVQVRISGGTAGVRYTGECVVTTSGGDTLSQQGALEVVA